MLPPPRQLCYSLLVAYSHVGVFKICIINASHTVVFDYWWKLIPLFDGAINIYLVQDRAPYIHTHLAAVVPDRVF